MIGLAYFALTVPVLIVDAPPLLDYANHNARLWMIAGGANFSILHDMYVVDWSRASTNIGIDLLAVVLGPLVGADHVGPLCLILSILLPCAGALMLHRRIFGGFHWWQLTFVLPVFGKTLLAGFMNFHVGVGVALVAAALDDRLARAGLVVAFIGRTLLATLALIFHPFAALVYGGLLLGLSIGKDLAPLLTWKGLASRILPGALAVAPSVVPVLLVMLFSPHPPVSVNGGHTIIQWEPFSLSGAAGDLLVAFHAYSTAFDGLVVLTLVAVAGVALLMRRLAFHGGLLLAGIAFMAVSLVMPTRIGDGYYLEYRLAVIGTFTLLTAVRPEFVTRQVNLVLSALFFVLALARTGVVGAAWVSAQQDIRSVRRAVALVPEGASILPLSRDVPEGQREGAPFGRYFGDIPAYWGYTALPVIQRHAFVPGLFAIAGQQPLRVREPWLAMSTPYGDNPPPIATLHTPGHPTAKAYLNHWRSFDYILLLNADAKPRPEDRLAPDEAVLVSGRGFAELYKVKAPVHP